MQYADPGIFGLAAATRGFATGRRTTGRGAPLTPPDPPDEYEAPAPYCPGPGHLYAPDPEQYDRTPGDLTIRVEDCPTCVGKVRNHRTSRRTDQAIEERAS